jgi:lipopolysaccharide/colanic/teichoic acid biosynthesis glycosyltransferase
MRDPSRSRAASAFDGTLLAHRLHQPRRMLSRQGHALLVVGSSDASLRALRERLEQRAGRAPAVVGIVSVEPPREPSDWHYLGEPESLETLLDEGGWSEVAVCLEPRDWRFVERVSRACSTRAIPMSIPIPYATHDGLPRSPRLSRPVHVVLKRLMDVVGAALGLVVSAPVLALIALMILVTDGGPIIFRQARAGQDGRPFRIVKFRTMHRHADGLRDSLRALRRTSLDEVPQFWNVLIGDMSLVGPRPHPYDDVAGYQAWQLQRLAVKPGLTGLWQVELRGEPDFDACIRRDLEYIARWSLGLDVRLVLQTIPAVIRGTGR